jgi:hypothetical protein
MVEIAGTPETQFGGAPTQISARVNFLARSGDKVNFQLITYVALQTRRCNAQGRLKDLSFDDII